MVRCLDRVEARKVAEVGFCMIEDEEEEIEEDSEIDYGEEIEEESEIDYGEEIDEEGD